MSGREPGFQLGADFVIALLVGRAYKHVHSLQEQGLP